MRLRSVQEQQADIPGFAGRTHADGGQRVRSSAAGRLIAIIRDPDRSDLSRSTTLVIRQHAALFREDAPVDTRGADIVA